MLYSTNIFQFGDLVTFNKFPTTILSSRLHCIRSVILNISGTFEPGLPKDSLPGSWTDACMLLSGMRGLQYLRIYLLWLGRDLYTPEAEYQVFAPLMVIRDVEDFVVNARWNMHEWGLWELESWKDKPFKVFHLKDTQGQMTSFREEDLVAFEGKGLGGSLRS